MDSILKCYQFSLLWSGGKYAIIDIYVLCLGPFHNGVYVFVNEPWPSGMLAVLPGVSVATCMAILQVGSGLQLRSASTGTKEEDYENDAATIVQKCVSLTTMGDGTIPQQELFGGVLVLMSNASVLENSWRSTKWLDRPSVTLAELEERWVSIHKIKIFE